MIYLLKNELIVEVMKAFTALLLATVTVSNAFSHALALNNKMLLLKMNHWFREK